jgi:hypothetical protein
MARVDIPSWSELTADGAVPMIVFRAFVYEGEVRQPGDVFSCENPTRMRQLYEQRKIRPAVSVAEAMQKAAEKLPRDSDGRFRKKG